MVRRIPDGNQASYHAEVQGLPWDTLKGSTEMLRNALVRPGEPPRPSRGRRRKDGSPAQARTATTSGHATRDDPMPGSSDDHLRQTATETDVIEQNIVMDSGTARASDDRSRPRSDENGSRRRDFRRRTSTMKIEKQTVTLTDDETVSKRLKREATIATIKQEVLKMVAERPELEHAHEFYSSIRTLRSPESIQASRMVEINKWREREEELLNGGVVMQRLQLEENFSMHAGWMNSTRRSHDMWSRTSRTHVIRRCLQQPVIQQLEEW